MHVKLRDIVNEKKNHILRRLKKSILAWKLHVSNANALKETLRSFGCVPFSGVNARDIAIGK